jgi:hypothetical protein
MFQWFVNLAGGLEPGLAIVDSGMGNPRNNGLLGAWIQKLETI